MKYYFSSSSFGTHYKLDPREFKLRVQLSVTNIHARKLIWALVTRYLSLESCQIIYYNRLVLRKKMMTVYIS